MPFGNITLGNPYSKPPVNTLTGTTAFQFNNPLSKPLYSPAPKPTNTTVGNVKVNTTKPVLLQTQQGDAQVTGDDLQKPGFWASKTKKQKTAIIISVVAGVSLLTYIALKKK
jgi:type IV secretory pathway VirB6-like protein